MEKVNSTTADDKTPNSDDASSICSWSHFTDDLDDRSSSTQWLGVVQNPAIDLLLGAKFIDRCIGSIFHMDRKIVSLDSRSVVNQSAEQHRHKSANTLPEKHQMKKVLLLLLSV